MLGIEEWCFAFASQQQLEKIQIVLNLMQRIQVYTEQRTPNEVGARPHVQEEASRLCLSTGYSSSSQLLSSNYSLHCI